MLVTKKPGTKRGFSFSQGELAEVVRVVRLAMNNNFSRKTPPSIGLSSIEEDSEEKVRFFRQEGSPSLPSTFAHTQTSPWVMGLSQFSKKAPGLFSKENFRFILLYKGLLNMSFQKEEGGIIDQILIESDDAEVLRILTLELTSQCLIINDVDIENQNAIIPRIQYNRKREITATQTI